MAKTPLPVELVEAQQQFHQWRRSRTNNSRIPTHLWELATTLAHQHGLLKYGSGLPFNRLEGLQRNLQIPLPASTQWDVLDAFVPGLIPAYEELICQAAQGDVLCNDDTTVTILALMGHRHGETDLSPSRSGLFTSGVVSTCAGHRVALIFSGTQHASETWQMCSGISLELPAPIQMCDALSRNVSIESDVIVSNCLAHARRKFVELYDRFPGECRHVLEALKSIYHHDAIARREQLTAQVRLDYHQVHSEPIMANHDEWLNATEVFSKVVFCEEVKRWRILVIEKHFSPALTGTGVRHEPQYDNLQHTTTPKSDSRSVGSGIPFLFAFQSAG